VARAMRCPACRTHSLVERRVENRNVALDLCPDCKGIWFDAGELAALLPVAARRLCVPRDAAPSDRACPRCSSPLRAFHYPGTQVTVDLCGKCGGLWLDAGEAAAIRAARQTRAQARTSPRRSGGAAASAGGVTTHDWVDVTLDVLGYVLEALLSGL